MFPVKSTALATTAGRTASLAERAHRLKLPPAHRRLPSIILMTDPVRLPDPLPAIRQLPRQAAVIFRNYGYDATDRLRTALPIAKACRRRGVPFLVAADWRLAAEVRADGLHLPEWMVSQGRRDWRGVAGRLSLITAAAHSPAAVRRAIGLGVDAVLLSPVFPTASHPGAPTLGLIRFIRQVSVSPIPVYALGGITPLTAKRLAGSGAAGVAGISGFSHPHWRSRTLR
ncbi:MAG: thiamine phosphate synthase, partial [Rhodospirillales bacterium]|nr:thiamine phosphate synthase [Rhodospirillales bacterium]